MGIPGLEGSLTHVSSSPPVPNQHVSDDPAAGLESPQALLCGPAAAPQLFVEMMSKDLTMASANLQRLTALSADQFTIWNLRWRPPSSMSWAATLGDGSCFWHALLKSANESDTLDKVTAIKNDILDPPVRLRHCWTRCFGGNIDTLNDELQMLNQLHSWADWKAVGLAAYRYNIPIAIWDTRAHKVTLHWSPQGGALPQLAWLFRLHQDHFEPALRQVFFIDFLHDRHGEPLLARPSSGLPHLTDVGSQDPSTSLTMTMPR